MSKTINKKEQRENELAAMVAASRTVFVLISWRKTHTIDEDSELMDTIKADFKQDSIPLSEERLNLIHELSKKELKKLKETKFFQKLSSANDV